MNPGKSIRRTLAITAGGDGGRLHVLRDHGLRIHAGSGTARPRALNAAVAAQRTPRAPAPTGSRDAGPMTCTSRAGRSTPAPGNGIRRSSSVASTA